MYELIITEKPNAAKKIAEALADNRAVKYNINGVPYYKLTHGKQDIVVGCAVGHLYTLTEKEKKAWTYPVFDVMWIEGSKVSKAAAFSSKYVFALKKLAKDANKFTIACDFDVEGEVIGYNILKFICRQKDANRMKFSTLTKNELRQSYEYKMSTIDWGMANAGLTRHELDWYYGINLSRALTLAMKSQGYFKLLSSGRVQGPALKIIVDREKEIKAFKPEPFWQIQLLGHVKKGDIEAWHIEDKFWEKKKADEVIKKTKGKNGFVAKTEKKQFNQTPPTPFDLTTLQTEAYRCHRVQPKRTLEIAQELYTSGYISYPRTSSQQLPPSIGYKKIMNLLSKQKDYTALVGKLINSNLKPNNGKKTDPAHPAIYPTGFIGALDSEFKKIYDLIVKRFLATFAELAVRETMSINIDVNKEIFVAKGTRTISRGWHEFYAPYVKLEEQELPSVNEKDDVKVKKINLIEKQTQPAKRYTQASIIRELEKRDLGTKATRATIVDTLYNRGYVTGAPIEATELGIHTTETLEKYSPQIVDEELTRHFEVEMEEIREKKKKNKDVLQEAKDILTKILAGFKKKEKEIGKGLIEANKEAEAIASTVGKCPNCAKGTLMLKKGKYGRFVACDKYPECKTTYNLPNTGIVKTTEDKCEHCEHPMLMIIRKKKAQKVCLNPDCKGKKITDKEAKKEMKKIKSGKIEKKCPKCKEGNLVIRQSVYGKFYACDKFPKCRYTQSIKE